jgi:hypothetical protein
MVLGSSPKAAGAGAPKSAAFPVGFMIRCFTIGIPLLSTTPDCQADSYTSRQLTRRV